MSNNYTVYMHVFPNNKKYIGITMQKILRRWRYNGTGYKGQIVYNAIQKYGWENVKHEILFEHLTKEEAENKEKEMIKKYKSNNIKYGYNVEKGGFHNGEMAESTKEKLRKINLGRKMSEIDKKHLIENIPKKEVYQFDKNFNFIKKYCSVREASRQTGIDSGSISSCCQKKANFKSAGGYIWSYTFEINLLDYEDGRKISKKVYQYTKNNELVKIWNNCYEAEKQLKIYHISDCLNGKRKSAGGYIWRYE